MKVKFEFLYLPEELHNRILSFLPYRDILRCTSVCKALHQVYISSSELQYIVELGGQRLLPIPCTNDNTVSISKYLQLLKDKAHAWFKFDIHSFETVSIPGQFYGAKTSLANGHLCLWNEEDDSAKIFPVLPKPSQHPIERDWPPGSLCSLPNSHCADVFMDPAQNLIAIAYCVIPDESIDTLEHDERFFIELGALDGDGVHPKAAGRTLYLSELPGREGNRFLTESLKLEGMGRHIALRRALTCDDPGVLVPEELWSLHIWDWQESTTSNSVLVGTTVVQDPDDSMDFCFLGNDRLLTVSQHMKLYSIEDMSRAPQLLACFLLPVSVVGVQCLLPMDDISPISHLQAQPEMWASDPENRLLSLITSPQDLVFIISTRIFFDLGLFEEISADVAIEWRNWGPSNTRVFQHDWRYRIGVSGNRVLQSFPVIGAPIEGGALNSAYRLHMMDFSPIAVERRQGLGRVVTEPSSIKNIEEDEEAFTLTTFLAYVEVVSDRMFGPAELVEIWVDKDRIYLPKDTAYPDAFDPSINYLEVIDI